MKVIYIYKHDIFEKNALISCCKAIPILPLSLYSFLLCNYSLSIVQSNNRSIVIAEYVLYVHSNRQIITNMVSYAMHIKRNNYLNLVVLGVQNEKDILVVATVYSVNIGTV